MASDALTAGEMMALLRASSGGLAGEVLALGERAGWRPAPGEWSANEVLGHVIEADRRRFAGRAGAVLATDDPTPEAWDQQEVAAGRRDDEKDPEVLVAEFLARRKADLKFVAGLAASDLACEWIRHDREHLGQMLRITQSLASPAMENARLLSDPDD